MVTSATSAARLATAVPTIFYDCQKSLATHRKNTTALVKVYQKAVANGPNDEKTFLIQFITCVRRLLPLKKAVPAAEKVVKFVDTFLKEIAAREAANKPAESEEDEDEDVNDSASDRFITVLIKYLLQGMGAKDKNVRARACQLIGKCMNHLNEMDDDMYQVLITKLVERSRDKEALVRAEAVVALSRLQDAEEEGDIATEALLDLLQFDPSPDVRKKALLNIEFNRRTTPFLLERARDSDASVRKLLFSRISDENIDIHRFTIKQRNEILKSGLMDRDANVKKHCLKMLIDTWFRQSQNNLVKFVEVLDVVNNKVAEEALKAILMAQKDLKVTFNDEIWNNLTMEVSFIGRVLCDFLKSSDREDDLDDILPEVSKHAQYLSKHFRLMNDALEEDIALAHEFILGQLLEMARMLDYADEVGRRNMIDCLKQLLTDYEDINEDHMTSIVEIMKKISLDEKDFITSMGEIISDIREMIDLAAENAEAAATLAYSADDIKFVNFKSLVIIRSILENVSDAMNDTPTLFGWLHKIVIPSVMSNDPELTEFALQCLGLCCTLNKDLATNNMHVFAQVYQTGILGYQVQSLKTMFDLSMLYGVDAFPNANILTVFREALVAEHEEIITLAVEGVSKLMLLRNIRDEEMLKGLVILFYHPHTAKNIRLRQCLSYFLTMYAHSAHDNQKLVAKVVIPAFRTLLRIHRDMKDEMVAPLLIAQQMIDWTDPRKLLSKQRDVEEEEVDMGLQADIAIAAMKMAYRETQVNAKLYCQMLPKLYMNGSVGTLRLRQCALLVSNLRNVVSGSIPLTCLKKFATSLVKLDTFAEPLSEEEFAMVQGEYMDSFGEVRVSRDRLFAKDLVQGLVNASAASLSKSGSANTLADDDDEDEEEEVVSGAEEEDGEEEEDAEQEEPVSGEEEEDDE